MIITIDGPTASGKSTVARAVAQKLDIYYLCSGLLFRGLAYVLLFEKKYALDDLLSPNIADVDELLCAPAFEYRYEEQKERVFFKNIDITPELKSSIIDQASSRLSANQYVRQNIMQYQRHIASTQSLVVDGRDTGSVVFPDADYKFFLTASLEERASRWQKDQEKRGSIFTLQQAIERVKDRDMRDTQRAIAPLVVPHEAIIIDSSNLTIEQVIHQIISHIV